MAYPPELTHARLYLLDNPSSSRTGSAAYTLRLSSARTLALTHLGVRSLLRPSALQHRDILLTRHRTCVMRIDHLYAGTCIAGQGDQINALPVQQTKSDSAMAKAIKAARLAVGPGFEAGLA